MQLALEVSEIAIAAITAKLRLHYWEDEDGPAPRFTYAALNTQGAFNCNLGGNSPGINIRQLLSSKPTAPSP